MSHPMPPVTVVVKLANYNAPSEPTHCSTTKALGDLERCVKGYSKRDGLFGAIGTLLHRIWNAVKAIFGQSEWQKARRAVKTLCERQLLPLSSNINRNPDKYHCDLLLKKYIAINENKSVITSFKKINYANIDLANATYMALEKEVSAFMEYSHSVQDLKQQMNRKGFMETPTDNQERLPVEDQKQQGKKKTTYKVHPLEEDNASPTKEKPAEDQQPKKEPEAQAWHGKDYFNGDEYNRSYFEQSWFPQAPKQEVTPIQPTIDPEAQAWHNKNYFNGDEYNRSYFEQSWFQSS